LTVVLGLGLAACATASPAPTAVPAPTSAPAPISAPAPTAVPAPEGGPLQEIGEGEGAVSIIAWAGYIERGEYLPEFDWVTGFEAETGCLVSQQVAATSDEMVALMTQGGFDLVTASGDASNRLISAGLVQEINIDLVPSYSTIDERLQNAPWHTVDTDGDGAAEHYGASYQSGSNVLMYNTEVFTEPPTSWSVVFEETTFGDGQSNDGRIEAYDGAIYIADAALYLKYHNPELGIENPYELTRDQFNAALDLLRVQRDLVNRYWHDAYIQMDDFVNEGVVASASWPFMVIQLVAGGAPIASVIPVEGATGWADTTMMHSNAPHPNCAYKWLEHSLNKQLQGDLAAFFGTVPAVLEACEGNALLGPAGCGPNGLADFDKILFWTTPSAACGFDPAGDPGPNDCVPYYEWVTSMIAVIGGR